MLELALVRWALEQLRGARLRAGDPAGARARAGAVRHRLPARHRAADLHACPTTISTWSGTSEVALASLHDGEIVEASGCRCAMRASRPASGARPAPPAATRAASSACTSSTRSRCSASSTPERSGAEHERILAIEEELLRELGLPYRVVNIAVGDLGNSAAKKYDCEAWLPSQGRYRELTSCSNTTDYQARRLGIRARAPRGGRRDAAHAQRDRGRGRPHADRAAGERPARGRQRGAAGVPARLRRPGGAARRELRRLSPRRVPGRRPGTGARPDLMPACTRSAAPALVRVESRTRTGRRPGRRRSRRSRAR